MRRTQPEAEIILDSLHPYTGVRLTTMKVTFHRFILAEMNTHRVFSRNSASSRAIPVKKRIQEARENYAEPMAWHRNRAGMHSGDLLGNADREAAQGIWHLARRNAIHNAIALADLEVHKSLANRLLEPYIWHTALISSTEWENFFKQRLALDEAGNPLAQPEMYATAFAMRQALDASEPVVRHVHVPFGENIPTGYSEGQRKKIAVARCARTSYNNFDGTSDPTDDIRLFGHLSTNGHWSPFEHVAYALQMGESHANFKDWEQLRFYVENGIAIP